MWVMCGERGVGSEVGAGFGELVLVVVVVALLEEALRRWWRK